VYGEWEVLCGRAGGLREPSWFAQDVPFLVAFLLHLGLVFGLSLGIAGKSSESSEWLSDKGAVELQARAVSSVLLGSILGGLWLLGFRVGAVRRWIPVVSQPASLLSLLVVGSVSIGAFGRAVEGGLVLAVAALDLAWTVRNRHKVEFLRVLLDIAFEGVSSFGGLAPVVVAVVVFQIVFVAVWTAVTTSVLRHPSPAAAVFALVLMFLSLRWTTSVARRVVSLATTGLFVGFLAKKAADAGIVVQVNAHGGFFGPMSHRGVRVAVPLNPGPARSALLERAGRPSHDEEEVHPRVEAEDKEETLSMPVSTGAEAPAAAYAGSDAEEDVLVTAAPGVANRGVMHFFSKALFWSLGSLSAESLAGAVSPPLWSCLRCLHSLEGSRYRSVASCSGSCAWCVRGILRRSHPFGYPQLAMSDTPWFLAAEQTWSAIEAVGAEAVVADDAIHRLLVLTGYVAGGLVTLLTGALFASPTEAWTVQLAVSFCAGYVGLSVCLAAVEACVSTLMSLFAVAPAAIARTYPLVFHRYSRLSEFLRLRRGLGAPRKPGSGSDASVRRPEEPESALTRRQTIIDILADDDDGSGTTLS
jgi:hypothetical protein